MTDQERLNILCKELGNDIGNRAFAAYKFNNSSLYVRGLDELLSRRNIRKWLIRAFVWDKSREGRVFWEQIYDNLKYAKIKRIISTMIMTALFVGGVLCFVIGF